MSIPTRADISRTQLSGANTTSPIDPLISNVGIDPSRHPDWAGVMQLSDCEKARNYFNGRVAFYNPKKPMTFWSQRWTVRPPGDEFELPFGTRYSKSRNLSPPSKLQIPLSPLVSRSSPKHGSFVVGLYVLNEHRQLETCTLLLRMAKDFGNNVLPIGGEFSDETDNLPAAILTWEDILDSIKDTLEHVEYIKTPDWTYGYSQEGHEAVVMFIPSSSVMSRRWTTDMRAGLGDVMLRVHGPGGSLE
ncbi:MAG: hypothetical protein L6R38_007746 [Xanthoria sp. 2 TBL-2021]|nr:MAG: hypothetical protein L6R38_007746 [Xanthoria sp. 2 TBL-2021]